MPVVFIQNTLTYFHSSISCNENFTRRSYTQYFEKFPKYLHWYQHRTRYDTHKAVERCTFWYRLENSFQYCHPFLLFV